MISAEDVDIMSEAGCASDFASSAGSSTLILVLGSISVTEGTCRASHAPPAFLIPVVMSTPSTDSVLVVSSATAISISTFSVVSAVSSTFSAVTSSFGASTARGCISCLTGVAFNTKASSDACSLATLTARAIRLLVKGDAILGRLLGVNTETVGGMPSGVVDTLSVVMAAVD